MSDSAVDRPRRRDIPFSHEPGHYVEITDDGVDHILRIAPFRDIDATGFKPNLQPGDILRNDTRLVDFETGDMIVRLGTLGGSDFFSILQSPFSQEQMT